MLSIYLIPFISSLALSLTLTRFVRNGALRCGWMDPARRGRHIHTHPVPRLGGIAIFLAFAGAIAFSSLAPGMWGHLVATRTMLAVLLPALIVFILGFCDDLKELSPNWQFSVQGIAAVSLYANGVGVHRLDFLFPGELVPAWIGLPLTVVWVLLITNAFNLIDGLDGLAAGSATFSTIIIFAVSLLRGVPLVSFLAIALLGALLGFLRYNMYPATIFLGDSGSLFIGFLLSALALAGSQKATTIVAVAIPVLSFGLPILDVALAVLRRFIGGKPLFRGDDDHIHHKLLKLGLSHRDTVLILYAVTSAFGLSSLVLLHGDGMIALVLLVIGLGVWLGVQQLHYAEFGELRSLIERAGHRRQVIVNNLAIRRATESLKTCDEMGGLGGILSETLGAVGFAGFEISSPQVERIPQRMLSPFQLTADGRLRYDLSGTSWREPEWEMRIELVTRAGERWGQFGMFRECFEEPLLVDIHILNGDFRKVLVDAIQRCTAGAQSATRECKTKEPILIPRAVSVDAD